MTSIYQTTLALLVGLPVLAWVVLAQRPASVVEKASRAQADHAACTESDFNLIGVRYQHGADEYQATPITTYPDFPGIRTFLFTDPGAVPQSGARFVVTWELKQSMVGTERGQTLMQNAATLDDWYVRAKFYPNITFPGNVTVQGTQIVKELPLDGLYNPYYSIDFRVVYQDSPTCTSTQDPPQQLIAFYDADISGGGDDDDGRRDRQPPRRRTSQLTWTTQITSETLGETPASYVDGKTLSDIVNSRETGRPDNQLCSNCHYTTTSFKYKPPVDQGRRSGTEEITPTLVIPRDGRNSYTWNGSGSTPIVDHFVQSTIGKPEPLEAVFEKWLSDGGQ